MKFVSAILTVLAASASVSHARISSKVCLIVYSNIDFLSVYPHISTNFVPMQILQEDKGYEEWGHRSLKQEATSMSMPNTTMVMLSEISEEVELDEFESTIVGGGFATPGERPYLVRVQSVQIPVPPPTGGFVRQGCGGSLITPNVVLTAAHCMYDANTGNWAPTDFVEFHRHDVNDNRGVIVMNIRNLAQVGGDVVHHPSYRVREHDFDLALIFLPMAVSGITPVTLNENSKVPATAKSAATGAPLDIAGWGEIFFDGPTSPVLKETTLNYITNKQCTSPPSSITPNRITNNMMCVAHAAGTAECRGDSGRSLL
jgi:secreted trypsin-like serine protease